MIHRQFSYILLILVIFIYTTPAVPALAEEPQAIVEGFQNQLIAVMKKAENMNMKGRVARLAPQVKKAFKLSETARIAVGTYWKDADDSRRRDLIRAFTRMSLSTLATHFDGYSGERFEITGEQPGPQGTRMVLTRLVLADGDTVAIDYVMVKFENTWKVIDVILDKGISELSVRRSEYSLVLRTQGIEGLIRLLDSKADELMAQ
ncbi:MAG: ABC transporter substrate-binding protein [Rhodospirillaceae bacterium]|nr:ABC transporter substrate-binding protein [Rhodospirillaceae bacterium]